MTFSDVHRSLYWPSIYADCSTHVTVLDRMIERDGSRGYTAAPLY